MTLPGVSIALSTHIPIDSLVVAVNHFQIFRGVGIELKTYPYYDPATIGLGFDKYLEFIKSAAPRTVFVLHACAHNPTGVDPTREQWSQIADVISERGHYVFFDSAYQGFASGDLDADAWAVREFVKRGIPLLICQVCRNTTGYHRATTDEAMFITCGHR